MAARTPSVERRAARKGSQDHKYIHKQDGQRCRDDRGIIRIGKRSDDADKITGLKPGIYEEAHCHQVLSLRGQRKLRF